MADVGGGWQRLVVDGGCWMIDGLLWSSRDSLLGAQVPGTACWRRVLQGQLPGVQGQLDEGEGSRASLLESKVPGTSCWRQGFKGQLAEVGDPGTACRRRVKQGFPGTACWRRAWIRGFQGQLAGAVVLGAACWRRRFQGKGSRDSLLEAELLLHSPLERPLPPTPSSKYSHPTSLST